VKYIRVLKIILANFGYDKPTIFHVSKRVGWCFIQKVVGWCFIQKVVGWCFIQKVVVFCFISI